MNMNIECTVEGRNNTVYNSYGSGYHPYNGDYGYNSYGGGYNPYGGGSNSYGNYYNTPSPYNSYNGYNTPSYNSYNSYNYYNTPDTYYNSYYTTPPSPVIQASQEMCKANSSDRVVTKSKIYSNSIVFIPVHLNPQYYYDVSLKFEIVWNNGSAPFDWPNPFPIHSDFSNTKTFYVDTLCE